MMGSSYHNLNNDYPNRYPEMPLSLLYIAAVSGDWELAWKTGELQRNINCVLTKYKDTSLHVAARANQLYFVKMLIQEGARLEYPNDDGYTALSYAAAGGSLEIAEEMVNRNRDLPNVGCGSKSPLYLAAIALHKPMVEYLYDKTAICHWNEEDRVELFTSCIRADLYELALGMLKKCPKLGRQGNKDGDTALLILARTPSAFDGETLPIWRRYFSRSSYESAKLSDLRKLVKELCLCTYGQHRENEVLNPNVKLAQMVIEAAVSGNTEFIVEIFWLNPSLIFFSDNFRGTIFHIAIKNRHEEIFSMLYELGSFKDAIRDETDFEENNLLHLAALLAPRDKLNNASGAALQMHQEILWFKEVEKIVHPSLKAKKNKEGKTPEQLFNEKHEHLRKEGENWMRETGDSSMIVAALVTTVALSAAFNIPGGYDDKSSKPKLSSEYLFTVFSIANAVSLVSSLTSLVMFHSIRIARYAENDFLKWLPLKLMFGIIALLISLAAAMISFFSIFLLNFHQNFIKTLFCYGVVFLLSCSYFKLSFPALLLNMVPSTLHFYLHYRPHGLLLKKKSKLICPSRLRSSGELRMQDDQSTQLQWSSRIMV